jgi:hypothetical protein
VSGNCREWNVIIQEKSTAVVYRRRSKEFHTILLRVRPFDHQTLIEEGETDRS